MSRGLTKSSRYSPGNMDAASLEALFVGREKMLTGVLRKLTASTVGGERHYVLLMGPRGSGKTHFVALAYHRLMSSPRYEAARERLLVAYFNEEEWGVASYLDFLLRIIQTIPEVASADSLTTQITQTFKADPSRAMSLAESALAAVVGDRTLLLICENLNDLFDGLGEEGQRRLRAFIQQCPFWSILATTPTLFPAVRNRESPFYGFFTIRRLEQLDLETAIDLLRRKAIHEDKPALAKFLSSAVGRARVRAIHHLAGGNHRVYVVFFDFLDHQSLDDLVTPFLRMVDDLTPYYQDRMRQLAPRQRKIVEYLARQARAIAVKGIAEDCLMSEQTAAKQLGELSNDGFVTKTVRGRESYYELAEPLMRICVEVKDNKAQHLSLFVEFLRNWFSARELSTKMASLCDVERERAMDARHLRAAVEHFQQDKRDPFLDSLTQEAWACLERQDFAGMAEVQSRLVADRGTARDYRWYALALRRQGQLDRALEVASTGLTKFPNSTDLMIEQGRSLNESGKQDNALAVVDRVIERKGAYPAALCLRGDILAGMSRWQEAIDNELELLRLDPNHHHAYGQLARAYSQLGKTAESSRWARRAVDADRRSPYAWYWLGEARFKRSNYRGAERCFQRVLEHGGTGWLRVSSLCRLGTCQLEEEKYDEVLDTTSRLLELEPDHWHAYLDMAAAQLCLGKTQGAIGAIRAMIEKGAPGKSCARGLQLLLDAREVDAVHALGSGVRETGNAGPVREVEAAAWLASRDFQRARLLLEGIPVGERTARFGELMMEAVAAGSCLKVAAAMLAEWLGSKERKVAEVGGVVGRIMGAVAVSGSPAEMAMGLDYLLPVLPEETRSGIVAMALTQLLTTFVDEGKLPEGWGEAVRLLESTLGTKGPYEIPLRVMEVTARYGATGDDRVLLELPKEQRELLRGANE